VPVLVGGAGLPERSELPEELTPLLRRQAVAVRDDAWHEDVDGLVRRLQAEIQPPRGRRRPVWLLAALAAVVVLGGIVAAFWATRRDSGSSSSSSLPPCSPPDDSWTPLPLATTPAVTYELTDGTNRVVRYDGTAVRAKRRQSDWRILVDVGVSNATAPVEGTSDDEWYVGSGDFNRVVVDGLAGSDPVCFNLVSGAQQLPPGQRNIIRLGFDSSIDPTRAELLLETAGPPIPLVQSPS
jgi:hypothetical protein